MSTRPTNRPAPRKRQPQRRKKQASILDRIMARVPFSQRTLQRVATWSILAIVLGGAVFVAGLFGIPHSVGVAIAEKVGDAGFRVEQIEVRGAKRMDQMTVYAVALEQKSRAMPLVDLEQIRGRLLQYGWVADAHVSRRLPDTLLIRIVERTPAAVWQNQGALSLIDREGNYLEPVSANAMPDLPLVIGPGADRQEPALQLLMTAAPALKPRVRAATWVGNRRWDLTFDTGETLMLPEGEAESADALRKFAEKDGSVRLLGGKWIKFDMRDPDRAVYRFRDGLAPKAPTTGSASTKPARTGARDDA